MAEIDLYSADQKSEFTIISQVFFDKLQKIKKYLAYKIGQDKEHKLLLQDLDELMTEALDYQLKVTIIGRQEDALGKVKSSSQSSELLDSYSEFQIITFPYNLNRLLNNCDLVFLVVDSSKKIIPIEKKLVIKSQEINIPLIIRDFNQSQSQIQSWLEHPNLSAINYFTFPEETCDCDCDCDSDCDQSHLLSHSKSYDNFLKIFLADTIFPKEAIFEENIKKLINKYFMRRKTKYWEEIKQHKQDYLSGENHPQVQEKIRQLPFKIQKILQYNFKVIRQTLQDAKQELINPFVSTSFAYNVQKVISDSTVIQCRENKKRYLNLVVVQGQHRQTLHRYVLELYQQRVDLWIEEQWKFLDQELKIFNELQDKSDRELEIINDLSDMELKLERFAPPVFDLSKYICPAAVSEISRTIFDYHYSQSAWFRIIIAIAVGAVFFFLTDRLFGFIFLIVQIVNLLTGQSPKFLKLKQQTKELKRISDNKYQNLVKFVADKLVQDINVFLDQQCQLYQDQVNSYIQESNRNLVKIKQKIILNQNKISELNQDQEHIMQIIKDDLS